MEILRVNTEKNLQTEIQRALSEYIPLKPDKICYQVFNAMLLAKPIKISGENIGRPLNDMDRFIITSIACLTDAYIREEKRTKGETSICRVNYGLGDDGEIFNYISSPFPIDLKLIISRIIDIFRVGGKQEAADIDGLRKKLQESIKNLSNPFLITISNEKGHKIRRVARFIKPTPDYPYEYNFSILFVYLSQFYDIAAFNKTCANYNIFGGDYIRLKEFIGKDLPPLLNAQASWAVAKEKIGIF